MSLASRLLARSARLEAPQFRVIETPDIAVPADDGVVLLTDLYRPDGEGPFPTIMLRIPYGREAFRPVAEVYAERGFNVVMQACRGTGGSGGEFQPLSNERADGLAALAWLKAQPWFDGRLGTSGPSYLGYCQWAIADALPARAAMSVKVSSAEFRSVVFPAGAFHLQLWLSWIQTMDELKRNPRRFIADLLTGGIEKDTAKAGLTLPLVDADLAAVGRKVPFWRRWFDDAAGNEEFWAPIDHRPRITPDTPPVQFITGWYDFMLTQLLADYALVVEAGHRPELTVGPWWHTHREMQADSSRQTLAFMRAALVSGEARTREKPVRLHIQNLGWRDFDSFPPAGANRHRLYLHPGHALYPEPPPPSRALRYLYDPADPTPNLGGGIFAFSGAGPVDNRDREIRADLLVFTSERLEAPLTVIGTPELELHVRAGHANLDVFVRLCDVDPHGLSINIADGLVRCTPTGPLPEADGVWRLAITLNAAGHCFRKGHRLRLQVSSGAYPRYARNTGGNEPPGYATTLVPNIVEVFHDPEHPSGLTLPVHDLV